MDVQKIKRHTFLLFRHDMIPNIGEVDHLVND